MLVSSTPGECARGWEKIRAERGAALRPNPLPQPLSRRERGTAQALAGARCFEEVHQTPFALSVARRAESKRRLKPRARIPLRPGKGARQSGRGFGRSVALRYTRTLSPHSPGGRGKRFGCQPEPDVSGSPPNSVRAERSPQAEVEAPPQTPRPNPSPTGRGCPTGRERVRAERGAAQRLRLHRRQREAAAVGQLHEAGKGCRHVAAVVDAYPTRRQQPGNGEAHRHAMVAMALHRA